MNYDAIAIGAGLSGCSAAIQLAKLGYRVLLLEQ
ncbi:MAG: FAD-dependent oxidoreductase, partial [Pseudanabaena sp.]